MVPRGTRSVPPSLSSEGAGHSLLTASCSALASHFIHSVCFLAPSLTAYFLSDTDIPALSFRLLECQSWQRVSSITWLSLFISQVGELKPREVKPRTRTLCRIYFPTPAVLCTEPFSERNRHVNKCFEGYRHSLCVRVG